jgi:DNA invertase Pin-like site-specific DNA recombinase
MSSHPSLSKVQSDHLDRDAIIYVRQSSLMQVRDNTASTMRQYDLVQRALSLGWAREHIQVIDQDQGHSGASTIGRDGFQSLVAEVGLKHCGAVLSLEVSRLARSCSDWYHLLEICALTDTLVIDDEGIYDPGHYNDRLLLGFKGTMSKAELHWLRQRLLGGKVTKAEQGTLRFRLPVGLQYDLMGKVVLDPDEEVQAAVRLIFALFEQYGSALAVVKHFTQHHLRFPDRRWERTRKGELVWEPLQCGRVLSILHNPFYAGAYVYGRTKTRKQTLPGEELRIKGHTRQVKQEDWPIVLRDVHPGYVTWEQFRSHQQMLDDNRTWRPEERRGAVREGSALLQGIVLCGICGRRMNVRYLRDGSIPSYECRQAHAQRAEKTCQTMRGDEIDRGVAACFLEAIAPSHLSVSLATLEELEGRARQIDRQWQLRLERVQYEADLARRRYTQVDPENRLVARNLERDWNEKLADVERLQREYAIAPKPTALALTLPERQRILALAHNVPAVWHAPTTTATERKQLVRFLIKDVTLTRKETRIEIRIRWRTEALTEVTVARPKVVADARRTSPEVVARIRELAPTQTATQIAHRLNEEGWRTGLGGSFTASKVEWVRAAYAIDLDCPEGPGFCPSGQRGDGRYSALAAAELLNVNVSTIADWCNAGILDCVRAGTCGPRWITLTSAIITELRKPTQRHWKRRGPRQHEENMVQ